jgi:hypothetical protein
MRKLERMGIFKEMHEQRHFDSDWEYTELRRKLSEAISRGYVEQVPVIEKPKRFSLKRVWYRDKQTGEIYYLIAPDGKSRGGWEEVDPQDIVGTTERIH